MVTNVVRPPDVTQIYIPCGFGQKAKVGDLTDRGVVIGIVENLEYGARVNECREDLGLSALHVQNHAQSGLDNFKISVISPSNF